MPEELLQARLRVEGDVHGVGYRAFCQELARGLTLTGYASNKQDGSVEVLVQGSPGLVNDFIDLLQRSAGPGRATRIELLEKTSIRPKELKEGFEQTTG